MKNKTVKFFALALGATMLFSCEDVDYYVPDTMEEGPAVLLSDVARMLSELPITSTQVGEVRDAVQSSAYNGYDDEYMLRSLLTSPGLGVGDTLETTKAASRYSLPLRDLIADYYKEKTKTKAGAVDNMAVSAALDRLMTSGAQIYWPWAEKWDGKTLPVITFDPCDGASTNIGYKILPDGCVQEVVVDEKMASERPVWVVNRNDDSEFTSLEMLRRQAGEDDGGALIIRPSSQSPDAVSAIDPYLRTLVLKSFKVDRNYDCWFCGASEYFIKIGSVEGFTASTEAEMRLYSPTVTDLMVIVRRSEVGKEIRLNAVLVSEWTSQLGSCAFMITEDDGGTQTNWTCTAKVYVKSKSFGFDLTIPCRVRDDIIWRGQLSSKYFEVNNDVFGRFGDVSLNFSFHDAIHPSHQSASSAWDTSGGN